MTDDQPTANPDPDREHAKQRERDRSLLLFIAAGFGLLWLGASIANEFITMNALHIEQKRGLEVLATVCEIAALVIGAWALFKGGEERE
jgi:hypothetical protein